MMLREKQLAIKFVSYAINELLNMGFQLNTSNMDEDNTIPCNEDLTEFAKFKINKIKEIIEPTFAEYGITTLHSLRKMFSPDQIVDIFIAKSPNTRHLKREHMVLTDKYKVDENSFKRLNDLPEHLPNCQCYTMCTFFH